jgi:hypothetical protein
MSFSLKFSYRVFGNPGSPNILFERNRARTALAGKELSSRYEATADPDCFARSGKVLRTWLDFSCIVEPVAGCSANP